MTVSLSFEAFLKEVQHSNLNYWIELSPFSAIIHLKKSLIMNPHGTPLNSPPPKSLVIDAVKAENVKLCQKVQKLENIIDANKKQEEHIKTLSSVILSLNLVIKKQR